MTRVGLVRFREPGFDPPWPRLRSLSAAGVDNALLPTGNVNDTFPPPPLPVSLLDYNQQVVTS